MDWIKAHGTSDNRFAGSGRAGLAIAYYSAFNFSKPLGSAPLTSAITQACEQ
jgi:hypothetical protein